MRTRGRGALGAGATARCIGSCTDRIDCMAGGNMTAVAAAVEAVEAAAG